MNPNKKACTCRDVTYAQLEQAVQSGASSFEEVQALTNCSKSCGRCADFIRHYVKELMEQRDTTQPPA